MSNDLIRDTGTRTLYVRVPDALYEQLEAYSRATERPPALIAQEALSTYLVAHSGYIQDIAAGLEQADRGDFARGAEVTAVMARYGA